MALLAYTGIRPEEAIGLTWDRVDLDKGYATIKQVVTYADKNKHTVINESPKTEYSQRVVILPQAAREILAPHKRASGYVLHGRNPDEPMPYSTWQKFTAKAALEQLGIYGKYSSYDFRSTFATQLMDHGLTTKQAADHMGHADSRMIERIYARTRTESVMKRRDLIEQMNAQFASN